MHKTINDSNENSKLFNSVNFNDDFDIENLDFKPLNRGLGFHQERERGHNRRVEAKSFKREIVSPTFSQTSVATPSSNGEFASKSELSGFYGEKKTSIDTSQNRPSPVAVVKESKSLQMFSWVIDCAVILFSVAFTSVFFVLFSGISVDFLTTTLSNVEMGIFASLFFAGYYMIYFTILDTQATPGKSLVGLRVVSSDMNPPTAKQTFIRALVSLSSFTTFGLPLLMDFQGKLSDTKVVK